MKVVEQLAMMGPAPADVAGADPAADQDGKKEHGTHNDGCFPSGN